MKIRNSDMSNPGVMNDTVPDKNKNKNKNKNENNNSIILSLQLNKVSAVLTGDAECKVWQKVAGTIPPDTLVFKVPQHGSVNGSFAAKKPCWTGDVPPDTQLGISTRLKPFGHPDPEVIDLLDNKGFTYFRTDRDYHITFQID